MRSPSEQGAKKLAPHSLSSFNLGLALGGAKFGAILWWSLAALFGIAAIWSAVRLGEPASPSNQPRLA